MTVHCCVFKSLLMAIMINYKLLNMAYKALQDMLTPVSPDQSYMLLFPFTLLQPLT